MLRMRLSCWLMLLLLTKSILQPTRRTLGGLTWKCSVFFAAYFMVEPLPHSSRKGLTRQSFVHKKRGIRLFHFLVLRMRLSRWLIRNSINKFCFTEPTRRTLGGAYNEMFSLLRSLLYERNFASFKP